MNPATITARLLGTRQLRREAVLGRTGWFSSCVIHLLCYRNFHQHCHWHWWEWPVLSLVFDCWRQEPFLPWRRWADPSNRTKQVENFFLKISDSYTIHHQQVPWQPSPSSRESFVWVNATLLMIMMTSDNVPQVCLPLPQPLPNQVSEQAAGGAWQSRKPPPYPPPHKCDHNHFRPPPHRFILIFRWFLPFSTSQANFAPPPPPS